MKEEREAVREQSRGVGLRIGPEARNSPQRGLEVSAGRQQEGRRENPVRCRRAQSRKRFGRGPQPHQLLAEALRRDNREAPAKSFQHLPGLWLKSESVRGGEAVSPE